ncbi:preprotein translocase subunit SecG [Eubacteriales bacterium OttesenSCG-928-M02]|nr:preprotein translocase subunit SecG [Eubacteriales bacterium OttesenSCG-928-M02]
MAMTVGKIVIAIISLALIVLVMLQKPKEAGQGSAFGGDTFFSKTKATSYEAKLERLTKIAAVVFGVASFALVLIQKFSS